jgi:pyruvate dehydrogenase complex dehydrogenase (E1) component
MKRMFNADHEDIFYYITLYNENYVHAAHAQRARKKEFSRVCIRFRAAS